MDLNSIDNESETVVLRRALTETVAALAVGMTVAHQFKPGATKDMQIMQTAMQQARNALRYGT